MILELLAYVASLDTSLVLGLVLYHAAIGLAVLYIAWTRGEKLELTHTLVVLVFWPWILHDLVLGKLDADQEDDE